MKSMRTLTPTNNGRARTRGKSTARRVGFSSLAVALGIAISVAGIGQANAASPAVVNLGTAAGFAVI